MAHTCATVSPRRPAPDSGGSAAGLGCVPALERRRFCLGGVAYLAWAGTVPLGALARTDSAQTLGTRGARIACTDWAAAESLALLGCMPIAVPELAVYRLWLPEPPLPANVADLGSRSEPNLELLAALAPERIVVSSWQAGLLGQFGRIAPTEVAHIFDGCADPYLRIRELLLQMGTATGLEAQAQMRLREFDTEIECLRAQLAAGADAARSVYMAVLHENGAQAFVYGQGSWVNRVLGQLGLRNAWSARTTFYGNSLVGIAALAAEPEAVILYLDQGARTRRAEALLRDSTLWRSLPAVASGRAHAIASFYALGGLASAQRCARLVVGALTERGHG
ncbi:ABC transporter substrate-binding protein [Achromobacter pulmonis]|uniref:ABC transporter, substrate binding protein n=2 Tax=Alcaligenaceae TaxID=506 RepID=A9IA92_BORPD|nr:MULTISPECIES: ABC transporter substrate-binding protein [Alcaligenaceae]PND33707.1 ABC transporter substrate-binding protein [Achromobacter pulmonis]CAP44558.1 ABC transporter, substrate binding protein [Bordetella petrii]